MVFPRAAFSEMMGWHGASDGLVEIWNGMPFFSPVWAARARAWSGCITCTTRCGR